MIGYFLQIRKTEIYGLQWGEEYTLEPVVCSRIHLCFELLAHPMTHNNVKQAYGINKLVVLIDVDWKKVRGQ